MQFAQKYSKIGTWPQHIQIYNLSPLGKDKKNEHAGRCKQTNMFDMPDPYKNTHGLVLHPILMIGWIKYMLSFYIRVTFTCRFFTWRIPPIYGAEKFSARSRKEGAGTMKRTNYSAYSPTNLKLCFSIFL